MLEAFISPVVIAKQELYKILLFGLRSDIHMAWIKPDVESYREVCQPYHIWN